MALTPMGLGTKDHYAGEGQQQFSSQSVMSRKPDVEVGGCKSEFWFALLDAVIKQRLVKPEKWSAECVDYSYEVHISIQNLCLVNTNVTI
jgi:hypothetical protein